MLLVLLLILFLVVYGLLEYYFHYRNIIAIPLRIHVNGTRGKSSVTRLIAAGLRAGGIKTLAKTTGTAPRVVVEDGTETQIYRPGAANIIEQIKFVSKVKARGAQALVVECMALQPELQKLTEKKMIRSHIGVITNARADHLDVMGPTVLDVAEALSNTIPQRGKFFTAENQTGILEVFKRTCIQHESELIIAGENEVSWDEMKSFSYIEHRENVALSLKVCEACGVSRDKALEGMTQSIADPGVLRIYSVSFFNKDIRFVNVFAANDPDSTLVIWNRILPLMELDRKKIVLVNSRGDRIQRSEQMGVLIAKKLIADAYILVGDFTKIIQDEAVQLGLDENKIEDMGLCGVSDVFEKVLEYTPQKSMVFAVGNIGGMGQSIVDFFKHRSGIEESSVEPFGAQVEPFIF